MQKHRLDCAGCSGSRVWPSRKSSKIKEMAPDIRTLSAQSRFRRKKMEKVSSRHAPAALWGSFRCSGNPLGSPRAAKASKKVNSMRAWHQPWHPEGPECYRSVRETSKMEPTWSRNGAKVIAPKYYLPPSSSKYPRVNIRMPTGNHHDHLCFHAIRSIEKKGRRHERSH